MAVIYSLGHSNRSGQAFLELLQRHDVELVADVRRRPISRFAHFNRDMLAALLDDHDVDYVHIEPLGAYRPGGYPAWMQTRAWQQAYRELVVLARRQTAAFMCAERLPQQCHRRYIARRLARDGWRVVHLIDGSAAQATLDM